MKIKQFVLKIDQEIKFDKENIDLFNNNESLAIIFVNQNRDYWKNNLDKIKKYFSKSSFVGCSTSGHIHDDLIYDDELIITFLNFSKSKFKIHLYQEVNSDNSYEVGKKIRNEFPYSTGSCLVLSEGLNINGSKFVDGLNLENKNIQFFGGLSGDSTNFKSTSVIYQNTFYSNSIIAVYFDENLIIDRQVAGGWIPFGIERTVTKSVNNVVYEFDNQPAIKLYEEYLGEKSNLLPAHGLHFPICIGNKNSELTTRTLLGISKVEGSLTYAGDIKENSSIRLMKATNENLIEASQSILNSITSINSTEEHLLVFEVSCVGRRIVLAHMTEDECALEKKSKNIYTTGFYSFGEINKNFKGDQCSLHNQTFTYTLLKEKL